MRRSARLAAAAAALLLVSGTTSGAAAAPAAWPWCIPLLMSCDEPTPTPSSTPSTPTVPGVPELPVPSLPTPGAPTDPDDPTPEVPSVPTPEPTETVNPVPDDGAPVFTQPPAQLGSEGLSFTGLRGIEIVTVPLIDGSRVAALKISADSITIQGFALTVGHADTPALATTADTMTLSGNVQVYLNSLTGTTADGTTYTLGADTPPPRDGIAPGLLRVTLGLVGATADSIVYSNTDQQLVE